MIPISGVALHPGGGVGGGAAKDERDLVNTALEACRELLSLEVIPELDPATGLPKVNESDECMKKGKKLKALADAKFARKEVKSALIDFVYSSMHFYRGAELMFVKEGKASNAVALLRQTAAFTIGCGNKADHVASGLSKSLLYYFAAVCYGRAFSVGAAESQRLHKAASQSLAENKPVMPAQLAKVLEASSDSYKALEWYRAAQKIAHSRLEFPHDVLMQSFAELEKFVDNAVAVIHQKE